MISRTKSKSRARQASAGVDAPRLVVRPNQIRAVAGISTRHANRLELAGEFPRKIRLGERAGGWLMSEISAWLAERATERDAGKSKHR